LIEFIKSALGMTRKRLSSLARQTIWSQKISMRALAL